jgi:hypothetical protein
MVDLEIFSISDRGNFGQRALWVGIIGLLISAVGLLVDRNHFFYSYLTAFAFWITIGLGALFFTMLHHLVAATWSVVLRRISENVMMITLIVAIFFLVIIAGIGNLYQWSHHDILSHGEILKGKAIYLNTLFFVIRSVIYLGVWVWLASALYKISLA